MVRAEIEDTVTGCTYIKDGKDVADCVQQFLDMFIGHRKYKILWSRRL
jgi:hypothetical protein